MSSADSTIADQSQLEPSTLLQEGNQSTKESNNNEIVKKIVNDDCYSSSSDEEEEDEEKASQLMEIISNKHKEIEQTVSLIKGENKPESSSQAFGGLTRLAQDDKIKSMIKDVAGQGTTAIIEETLSTIKSRSSVEAKQTALRMGVAKLQSNLASNEAAIKDPAFKLLLNVIGMNKIG